MLYDFSIHQNRKAGSTLRFHSNPPVSNSATTVCPIDFLPGPAEVQQTAQRGPELLLRGSQLLERGCQVQAPGWEFCSPTWMDVAHPLKNYPRTGRKKVGNGWDNNQTSPPRGAHLENLGEVLGISLSTAPENP